MLRFNFSLSFQDLFLPPRKPSPHICVVSATCFPHIPLPIFLPSIVCHPNVFRVFALWVDGQSFSEDVGLEKSIEWWLYRLATAGCYAPVVSDKCGRSHSSCNGAIRSCSNAVVKPISLVVCLPSTHVFAAKRSNIQPSNYPNPPITAGHKHAQNLRYASHRQHEPHP